MRACVRACMRACVRACMHARAYAFTWSQPSRSFFATLTLVVVHAAFVIVGAGLDGAIVVLLGANVDGTGVGADDGFGTAVTGALVAIAPV